ncbi:MAG TPA: hypothetical protein VJL82_02820 [Rhizomicrobium sp.]|nr:hypothetical protein [Rhizomicrobium sp.]
MKSFFTLRSSQSRRWAWIVFLSFCLPIQAIAADPYPKKFDLICRGSWFIAFRPYPATRGMGLAHTMDPAPYTWHFIVDLTTMQFCGDKYCSGGGHRKLARMEDDRIFFEDKLGMHVSVDLRTRKYVFQSEHDEGQIDAARATCRFAPFSGFRW